MIRRVCVLGGAGFIGSNFCDELLANDINVRVIDNLRSGHLEFIPAGVEFFEGDVLDRDLLLRVFNGCDWVAHFQASADIRHCLERVDWDFEQNALATLRVLEAMRHSGVKKIFFASTAAVYGNLQMDGIPEDAPFPIQTSLYGAAKAYSEGLITSYCEGFGFSCMIGRWGQAVGPRYHHGHIIEFMRALLRDPTRLEILGDGQQRKSSIHVEDLTRAILLAMRHHDEAPPGTHIYNIAVESTLTVDESADLISEVMGLQPRYEHAGGINGGWPGDSPYVALSANRIKTLGWKPTWTIPSAITATAQWLLSPACTFL